MKKIQAIASSFIASAYFASAFPAFAAENINPCPSGTQFDRLCNLTGDNLGDVISLVVIVLLIAVVLIALFFLIFGGIKWIVSGGDKGGVEAARNMIIAAIVGLIIAFLAYFILQIALGFFNINLQELQLPTLPI